jgi:hypothetical protein
MIENVSLTKVDKIGKNGNGHLKIQGDFGNQKFVSMFWGK